ncbi:FGGY family carbohydrate kinase [Novosphingopyxis iocasae]|uniref:FGGY family carbohydrate kinase n=1 Tax=Novosphingopyxis iocasae TaxID=2762729 RepID=UPI0016518A2D|nr:glycerol kinase [Novosphingopyxis iocasae]
MAEHILVIDEGTTSTRAMLFTRSGECRDIAQMEITQHFPAPGHVEQDAGEIWDKTLACCRTVIERAGGARRILAIGITNQRETVVAWNRKTGEPLGRAIVWQDRRTADQCSQLRERGLEALVQERTGLLLDPYFSATKMRWLLENESSVAEAGDDLCFGTIESWIAFKLTGGLHISDASNASRTSLMALGGDDWDAEMLELFGVPRASLPAIVDSHGCYASTDPKVLGAPIPICGMAGDQQAASIGQARLAPGDTKATFGTGAFILTHSGSEPVRSANRLLSTVLFQQDGEREYALEGSIFVAGSLIKWLRDGLGILRSAAETAQLAASVPDNGGVMMVPALSGLGAPHWRPDVRGMLDGLDFSTGAAHLARAALEAIAHQASDLQAAFAADGVAWNGLSIDGGMAANDWMAQDLADILDLPVERPNFIETTALGAAMLAACGAEMCEHISEAADEMRGQLTVFEPRMTASTRERRLNQWHDTLAKALG